MEEQIALNLQPYIYHRTYLEDTYIYDVKNKRVYLFNSSAGDMIDIIEKNPDIALCDFCTKYADIYGVEVDAIEQDTLDFIDMLISNDIVFSTNYKTQISGEARKIEREDGVDYFEQIDDEIHRKTCEAKIVLSALLEITYNCNEKCIHCYAIGSNDTSGELSTQDWFGILDQLAEAGVFEVTLTGGDVFMRHDFLEIFDYAISKRFLVNILSNGVLATDEQIRHIASKYPKSFSISLYGDTAEVHDSITQIPGSFEKSLNTLKKLKALSVSIVVNTVMMKQNAESYLGVYNLSKELGANFKLSISICGAKNGDLTMFNYRIDDIEVMKKIIAHIEKSNIEKFRSTPVEGRHHKDVEGKICAAGLNNFSINPFGEIFLCNSLDIKIGDVKAGSIIRQWTESPIANEFRKLNVKALSECSACENFDYCQFCPGLAKQETGSLVKPYAEACFIACVRAELREGGEEE